MTNTSKITVLSGVAICILVATLVVAFVGEAVSQGGPKSYEGYFAPVYSSDGQHVYFVERRTSGTFKETRSGDFLFRSSTYDSLVEKDTLSLKRLHVQSGQVEELIRFSPSPIEVRRYKKTGSPFQVADT